MSEGHQDTCIPVMGAENLHPVNLAVLGVIQHFEAQSLFHMKPNLPPDLFSQLKLKKYWVINCVLSCVQ